MRSMADRVGNSIRPTIPLAARKFLEEQHMVVGGYVGADDRVWASLLTGDPGFVRALNERTVRIDATPFPATRWRRPCKGQAPKSACSP